jgi:hypothetical protein
MNHAESQLSGLITSCSPVAPDGARRFVRTRLRPVRVPTVRLATLAALDYCINYSSRVYYVSEVDEFVRDTDEKYDTHPESYTRLYV